MKIRRSDLAVKTLEELSIEKWPNLSWSDAPAALIIDAGDRPAEYNAVWGLSKKMSVDDAWAEFDHSDEYEVV